MPLNLTFEKAELRNINIGKEGSGDQMPTRVDMKFVAQTTSQPLESFMEAAEHSQMFWRNGDVLPGVDKITLSAEWHHNILKFGLLDDLLTSEEDTELRFTGENVAVKKVTIKPMANCTMEVSFTAQLRAPDATQLKLITDFGRQECQLSIVFDDAIAEANRVVEEMSEDEEQDDLPWPDADSPLDGRAA